MRKKDGVNWEEEVIEERKGVPVVSLAYVFDGRFWLAFGSKGDLWSTEDGVHWKLESSRYRYPNGVKDVVECGGKLWLFSRSTSGNHNRVWSSEDGINWSLIELDASSFTNQKDLNVLIHNDEIWLFTYSFMDEHAWLWTSKDGKNWSKKSGSIYFGQIDVEDAYLVVFDEQLFVVGGNREISVDDKDNWSSDEGPEWVERAPDGFYSDVRIA